MPNKIKLSLENLSVKSFKTSDLYGGAMGLNTDSWHRKNACACKTDEGATICPLDESKVFGDCK